MEALGQESFMATFLLLHSIHVTYEAILDPGAHPYLSVGINPNFGQDLALRSQPYQVD